VEELQSNKASKSRFLTREEQENQIRRLEDLESKLVKPTLSDTNLMKGRSLLVIETNGGLVKKLVRPGTNLRFVPVEEMFDVLRKEHVSVYPESSPNTDIISFLKVTLWPFSVLPSEVGLYWKS